MADQIVDLFSVLWLNVDEFTSAAARAGMSGELMAEKVIGSERAIAAENARVAKTFAEIGAAAARTGEQASLGMGALGTSAEGAAAKVSMSAAEIARVNREASFSVEELARRNHLAAMQQEVDIEKLRAGQIQLGHDFQKTAVQSGEATAMMGAKLDAAAAASGKSSAQMSTAISAVGTSAEEAERKTAAAHQKSAQHFAMVGVAAAGAGAVAVTMAGNFEQSSNKLVTSAGESEHGLAIVRKGMLALAGEVGVSAVHLSDAMYKIESAGYHAEAGLGVLKAAEQGAKAEGADGVKVADALSSALRDYYPHAKSAAEVTAVSADVMSKFIGATSAGKMTFDDLAGSLNSILPVSSAANITLSDTLGVLASMTVHGISAEQATQNMADAIRHLQAPTMAMSKAMATLGIDSLDVAAKLGERGLSGTMQMLSERVKAAMPPGTDKVILELGDALSKSTPKVQELGQRLLEGSITMGQFSKEAKALDPLAAKQASSFSTLAGSYHQLGTQQISGAEVMQTYGGEMQKLMGDATGLKVALMTTGENANYTNDAIKTISGSTADAAGNVKGWSEVQNSFNQKMSEARAGLGAVAIQIGNALLPAVKAAAEGFAATARWMGEHPALAKVVAGALVGVTAGFLALAAGMWAASATPVAWIIGGIVVALGLLGVAIYEIVKHWQAVKDFLGPIVPWFQSAVIDPLVAAVHWLHLQWNQNWESIKNVFLEFWRAYEPVIKAIGIALLVVVGVVVGALAAIVASIIVVQIAGAALAFGIIWLATKFSEACDWMGKSAALGFSEMGRQFNQMGKSASDGVNSAIHWVDQLPARMVSALSSLQKTLDEQGAKAWSAFNHGIESAFIETGDFLTRLPKRFAYDVSFLGGVLYQAAVTAWKSFNRGLETAFVETENFLNGLPQRFAYDVGFLGGVLYQAAVTAWKGFNRGLDAAFVETGNFLNRLPNRFEHDVGILGEPLYQEAVKAWKSFNRGLDSAFIETGNFLNRLPNKFAHDIGFLEGLIYQAAVAAWNGFNRGLNSAFVSTGKFFNDLPKSIDKFFTSASTWLVDRGSQLLGGFLTGLVAAFVSTGKFFNDLPKNIDKFFTGASTWLVDRGSQLLGGFLTGNESGFTKVEKFNSDLPGNIDKSFVSSNTWLVRRGDETITGFFRGILDAYRAVDRFFSESYGRVDRFFVGANEWIVGRGIQLMDGFLRGILIANDAAMRFFADLPGRIDGFFAGANMWLYNVGQMLIQGLSNGISAASGWLYNKVASIGASLLQGFKDSFVQKSPSVLMADIGMNNILGLAKGMDDNAHVAVASARDMARKVVAAAQIGTIPGGALGAVMAPGGMTGGAAGLGVNQQPMVIELHLSNESTLKLDTRTVATEVQKYILRDERLNINNGLSRFNAR